MQNIRGEVKHSIGNGEANELSCTTHGHELRGMFIRGVLEADKGEKNSRITVVPKSIKYT